MTQSLVALCLFAAWTMLLVFSLAIYRVIVSQRTGKAVNSFSPAGTDVDAFGQRLTRAHLNCLELLPVVAAVILSAAVSGRAEVTDGLAMPLLYARLGQSVVHIASTATPVVLVRATLFVVQLAILAIWIRALLS
jgi:uncharacterized MAPEG superfamily protein